MHMHECIDMNPKTSLRIFFFPRKSPCGLAFMAYAAEHLSVQIVHWHERSCYLTAYIGSRKLHIWSSLVNTVKTDICTRHNVLILMGTPSSAVIKRNNIMQIVLLANASVLFMRHTETLQQAGSFLCLVRVSGIPVLRLSCAGVAFMQGL